MRIVSSAFRHGRSNGQACRNCLENRLDSKGFGEHVLGLPPWAFSVNGSTSALHAESQSSILSTSSIFNDYARLAEGISTGVTYQKRWFDSNTEYHALDSSTRLRHHSDTVDKGVRVSHRVPYLI